MFLSPIDYLTCAIVIGPLEQDSWRINDPLGESLWRHDGNCVGCVHPVGEAFSGRGYLRILAMITQATDPVTK